MCGTNGGGSLELHHITGRDSSATVNGAPVCHKCHEHICHNHDEEKRLTASVLQALLGMRYKLTEKDEQHFRDHPQVLVNNKYIHD